MLELDEQWSFVRHKVRQAWLWLALCRCTRKVIAFALGERTVRTCLRLSKALPSAYRQAYCFHDFWAAYDAVLPTDQHEGVGKETGETNYIERFNNTLRQRLGRLVRPTLSFSKSWHMHTACIRLFLHRYNLDRAALIRE